MKNICLQQSLRALLSSTLLRAALFGFFLVFGIGVVAQPALADTRTITNTLDSGSGSLRQTVSDASSNDTLVFDPAVFNTPQTITLTSGQIVIDKSLIIDGAAGDVYTPTVSGNNASRVFWVGPSINVTLNRLNIVNGYRDADPGGAGIYSQGALTVTNSVFISNTSVSSTFQYGGGIYNGFGGTLLLDHSLFMNNSGYYGGAIFNGGANTSIMSISNTTFISNVGIFGGAIANQNAKTLDIHSSSFLSNTASNYGGAIHTVSPLTVTNSTFNANYSIAGGGAIQDYGILTIESSNFFGNSANDIGGAINISLGTGVVTDSTFISNTSGQHGGAINIHTSSALHVINSSFVMNYSNSYGGGLSNDGSILTVTNSLMDANRASSFGGAIENSGWLNIDNSTLQNNLTGDSGGGLYINATGYTMTVNNSQFISNTVLSGGGGGIVIYGGTLSVTNSTFESNTAINGGGGLRNNGGIVLAVNDTFVANQSTSSNAGGIYNCSTNCGMAIINNTIVHNIAATSNAGGVSNLGTAMITNTLIADNSNFNCSGTAAVASANNLDSGATCGFSTADGSLNNTSPLLGNLGNYGGAVSTLPLLPGSPAIDAGTCQGEYTPTTDARGVARPQSAACDIGAFESRGFAFGTPQGSPQTATINTAFATPLSVHITSSYSEPVDGGSISFNTPATGASATLSPVSPLTIAGGAVTTTASANSIVGSYVISASAKGVNGTANFSLTNQPIMYSLTVHIVGNGNVTNTPSGSSFAAGSVVTLTATPNTGSSFANWSGNASGASTIVTLTMDSAKVVTATFTLNTYTLSTATTGNGSGTVSHVPAGSTFNYGTVITLTATPITGSSFTNWSAGVSGTGNVVTLTMDSDKTVTATFTLNTYTLSTATTGNGSGTVSHVPAGSTFNYGTVITLTATPITGSSFTNWSAGVNGTGQVVALTMDSDKTVTATFTLNTYTFSTATTGNGSGTVSHMPAGSTFNYGTVITLTAIPITGSSFTNWSAGVSGTGNVVTLTMDSNKAITATFTLNVYSLSTATTGNGSGSVSHAPLGSSFNYGTVVTLTASANNGSSFTGWSGSTSSANQVITLTMDSDKSITATFTLNTHALSTATTGNGSGTVSTNPPGSTFNYGAVVTLTATHAAGSSFTGWSGSINSTNPVVTVTMDGDKAVTATFTLNTYTISTTTTGNGSGHISQEPSGSTFNYGTVITLSAATNPGSSFGGWSGGVNSTDQVVTLTIDSDKTITATFTLNTYTLSTATDGNGSGTVSNLPAGSTFNYGTVVTLTAGAGTGSSFTGWSGSVISTSPVVTLTMDSDKTITATFTLNTYTLSTATDGNGSGTVSNLPAESTFNYGTVVTLTATAAAGSSLGNWSSGCAASGSTCVLSMTADTLITATFSLNSYTLTMAVEGSGSVSPTTGAHSYLYGTEITLTATPDSGWNFAGWSGDISNVGRTNPVTITISGDKAITATFSSRPVADAGMSRNVKSHAQVTLDGSNSTSTHMPLAYQWAQTGGEAVSLSSTTISQPVFTAPGPVSVTQPLTFTLVVTDQLGFASPASEVVITVTPYLVHMPIVFKP